MVKASDENVAENVSKFFFFLEDNQDVRGTDGGAPPSSWFLTYENTTSGYVGAVIILSLIFTLSVFVFMALYNVGK